MLIETKIFREVMSHLLSKECEYCLLNKSKEGDRSRKVEVVSMGTRVYLGITRKQPLVKYSCVIAPLRHTSNTLECDEDEWQEIKVFFFELINVPSISSQNLPSP